MLRSQARARTRVETKLRLEKIATLPPKKVTPIVATKVTVDVVEARDEAILKAINRAGGLVFAHRLRGVLPATDPAAADEDQAEQAITLALHRLKAKGVLARTGDTWSLVGIGMTAAVNG